MKTIRTAVVCLACIFHIFWFSGCSPIQPTVSGGKSPASAPEKYLTHTIKQPGENLITISRWYTGSGENWQQIAEANPTLNPRRIRIGDTVLIPENLLKTWQRMPVDYPEPAAAREEIQVASPELSRVIEPLPPEQNPAPAEIELFGPIDTSAPSGAQEDSGSDLPLETIE